MPQIIRNEGILVYSNQLAEKIDNMVLIPSMSAEEVEIRASAIWGVELIRQELGKYNAGEIDNAIWLIIAQLILAYLTRSKGAGGH